MQLSSSFCLMITCSSAEKPIYVISNDLPYFIPQVCIMYEFFSSGEVKKYNLAISAFFTNLKLIVFC